MGPDVPSLQGSEVKEALMRRHHPKILVGLIVLGFTALVTLIYIAGRYAPIQTIVSGLASDNRVGLQEAVTVRFSLPVNRRLIVPKIVPTIEGSWRWSDGRFARELTFQPETVWLPEQQYTISVDGVGPILSSAGSVVQFAVNVRELPTIVAASVSENATDVEPDGTIQLSLDQSLSNVVDFSFRLEPAADVVIEADPVNSQYRIRPVRPLIAGQSYRLIAERELVHIAAASQTAVKREPKEKIFERSFTVTTPPAVIRFDPSGEAVAPTNRTIVLEFSAAMDQASVDAVLELTPRLAGSWRWENAKVLVFEAQGELPFDTDFSVTIPAGVKDLTGTPTTEAIKVGFRTVGALRVVGATPNKKSGISRTSPVTVTFDQQPDQASVTDALSVQPPTAYAVSWQEKSLKIQPTNGWAYNTKYTIALRRGALGQYGVPSRSETIVTFTTEEKVVLLNIAWDRQDRALSCEAAALKMALAGKGVRVSEDDIMARVGYDPTPRTPGGWGDPDVAFVGEINGAQNTTGYGVHWDPIARAASAWRPARVVSGISLQEAARQLEAGNPIVIWGVQGAAYADPWVTPAGRTINAWKGEHARTLIGFRGSVDNPTSFIINDPIAGRLTWSAAKLRSDWSKFGFHGVVVE